MNTTAANLEMQAVPAMMLPQGDNVPNNMVDQRLKLENGEAFCFKGRLFSQISWLDEESGVQTSQELYTVEGDELIYYINRSSKTGGTKALSRSVYRLKVDGDHCTINTGNTEMTLSLDMLMLAVRGLCGLPEEAMPSMEEMKEMLPAANC